MWTYHRFGTIHNTLNTQYYKFYHHHRINNDETINQMDAYISNKKYTAQLNQ